MKLFFRISLCCLVLFTSCFASANRGFYAVPSIGFAKTELEEYTLDSFSYKLGVGYELSDSWNVEAGFQNVGEDNAGVWPSQEGEISTEYASLYLSALGKAKGEYGELFYRLGASLINADVVESTASGCDVPFQRVDNLCEYDTAIIAAHLGLGFDTYIHHSVLFRTEIEWTAGEDGFQSAGIYIGLRLNF